MRGKIGTIPTVVMVLYHGYNLDSFQSPIATPVTSSIAPHTLGYRIVPAQGLLFFEKMVHRFCLIRYAWLIFFEVSGSTYGKICAHELFNIGHSIQSLHSWWLFISPLDSSKPQTCLEGAVWLVQGVDPIKKGSRNLGDTYGYCPMYEIRMFC